MIIGMKQIESTIPVENDASLRGKTDTAGVIWTPRFIVAFAFVLVAGLSVESLLTQGWLNGYYSGQWVFQGHVVLVGVAWLALLVQARTGWARVGAISGLVWTAFMTVDILIQVSFGNIPLETQALVNVLICLSWLACSVCLSVKRLLLRPWDAWLLGLLPLLGVLATLLIFLLMRDFSLFALEKSMAAVELALSALVWLARPSCWRVAPAPTLLFGLMPIILFTLTIENSGYNAVNYFLARVVPFVDNSGGFREADFFFSQVALLCLLLGAMRLFKRDSALRFTRITAKACRPGTARRPNIQT